MKRSSSRELPALFDAAGLQARQKRHAGGEPNAHKQQHIGPRSGAPRTGYGLASSGLTRSGSLGSAGGGASSGGGGGSALAGRSRGLPEVTSPPPTRPLNFLAELPLSPFAKAASLAASAGAAPLQHGSGTAAAPERRQQLARRGASGSGSGSDSGNQDADWEEEEDTVLEDQENQQPPSCGMGGAGGSSGTVAAPATWLFSPVRPRPDAGSRAAPAAGPSSSTPASAPRPIPSPLLSPSVFMATPPKEALPAAAPASERPTATLTHAPSFGSWLMSACRPPSPPLAPPPPASVDVTDVVANLEGDCRAARKYERASGPSHLDRLLAEIGDTHYPASLIQWEQEELPDSDGERS